MPTNLERRLLILRFLHVLEPFFFGSRDDIIRRCCVERRCSLVISFDVRSSCQSPGFRTCRCDHTRDCFALPPLSNVSFAAFSTMVPKRSKPSVMPRKIEPMLSLHLTQTYISSIYQPAPPLSCHRLNTISIHAYPPLFSWHPPETEKTTPTYNAVRSRLFFIVQITDIHTSSYW